mgnify:CR=1 FL=1
MKKLLFGFFAAFFIGVVDYRNTKTDNCDCQVKKDYIVGIEIHSIILLI